MHRSKKRYHRSFRLHSEALAGLFRFISPRVRCDASLLLWSGMVQTTQRASKYYRKKMVALAWQRRRPHNRQDTVQPTPANYGVFIDPLSNCRYCCLPQIPRQRERERDNLAEHGLIAVPSAPPTCTRPCLPIETLPLSPSTCQPGFLFPCTFQSSTTTSTISPLASSTVSKQRFLHTACLNKPSRI